jgi:hypothetical protein
MLSPKLLFFVFGSFAGILCTLVLVPNHAFSAGSRFSDYIQGEGEDASSSSPLVDPVLVLPEPQACIVRSGELLRGSAGDLLAGEHLKICVKVQNDENREGGEGEVELNTWLVEATKICVLPPPSFASGIS